MPDVIVRNETNDSFNVAFRFVAPASWTNTLRPGDSWTTHLSSTPYTIEVRVDLERNRFSPKGSWATAGDIVGGWFAGGASVLGSIGLLGPMGRMGAVPLMKHAVDAGGRFHRNEDGMVISIGNVWIPFHNKTYAVRYEDGVGYSLWDVTDGAHKM